MSTPDPRVLLDTFALSSGLPLYHIGLFDSGVTIYKQQRRALNLAWSLIQSNAFPDPPNPRKNTVVIGAGFAGVTFAASLIRKRVNTAITLLERADTILPLQYGCHTRWVHPRIYDWPLEGSDNKDADLPVLNWRAGSAAEVADAVRDGWSQIVSALEKTKNHPTSLRVYCNIKHIRVHPIDNAIQVEYVGELRNSANPSLPPVLSRKEAGELPARVPPSLPGRTGRTIDTDCVIFATGFGVERDHEFSYWRNDTLSQPRLVQARETYIVSGGGDSALIDLLRLRIADFRQDRILLDLFEENQEVVDRLRDELTELGDKPVTAEWFAKQLPENDTTQHLTKQVNDVLNRLSVRLRNDTRVILHRQPTSEFRAIFENPGASFQNRLLVFLLWRCGGFIPSERDILELQSEYGVPDDRIIRRYGTNRTEEIANILSPKFLELFSEPAAETRSENQSLTPVQDYLTDLLDDPMAPLAPAGMSNKIQNKKALEITSRRRTIRQDPNAQIASISSYFDIAGHRDSNVPLLLMGMALNLTRAAQSALHFLASEAPKAHTARPSAQATFLRSWPGGLQQCCRFVPLQNNDNDVGRKYLRGEGIMSLAHIRGCIVRTDVNASGADVRRALRKLGSPADKEKRLAPIASAAMIPILGVAADSSEITLGVLAMVSNREGVFTDMALRAIIPLCDAFTKLIDVLIHTDGITNDEVMQSVDVHPSIKAPEGRASGWQKVVNFIDCAEIAPPKANASVLNLDRDPFQR